MTKLILKLKDVTLEEFSINQSTITIGRDRDNSIVIDNRAVSRHHVKICQDDNKYIIEDLNSGNGTFVNDKKITKDTLRNQDEILVGKHTLVFVHEDQLPIQESEGIASSFAEETVILDSKTHAALMALRSGQETAVDEPSSEVEGSITILAGGISQQYLALTKQTTVGGKSHTADIKLKGLFVGDPAFMIRKRPDGFFITHSTGKRMTKVNGEPIAGQRELQDGDIITVGATKMQFTSKKPSDQVN
jgi:pSer/pThr/pTyr-binding forkhead associated (FHA) protein